MYDYFVHWSSVVVRVMRRGSTPGGQMVALLVSSCTCSTTVSLLQSLNNPNLYMHFVYGPSFF